MRLSKWLLAGVLIFVLLALVLLPEFARWYAVKNSKEFIGRKFTIDHVFLNYFTSTVRISGFKLFELDEKEVFVSFEKLALDLQPFNLLRHEILIENFT